MATKPGSIWSGRIKRSLAVSFAAKLQENPEQFARLVEAGLIDPESLQEMVDSGDLGGVIREFKKGITELVAESPSVLESLDIRPLDIMATPSPPESLPSPGGPALNRIDRTIVFSDLEGFTSFTRERGDVEASALLIDHYAMVDAISQGRGGTVVKRLGDGHMLAFPQPAAAVFASLELIRQRDDLLKVRTGAHSGLVVEMTGDLFGDVVNVAARVADLAPGGQALVTVAVRDAVAPLGGASFGEALPRNVAGLEAPIDVCLVHASIAD